MTKKQIENMALYIALTAMDAERTGDNEFFSKTLKKAGDYFDLLFDLYIIDDMKKIDKIRAEVFKKAQEKFDEMRKENAA